VVAGDVIYNAATWCSECCSVLQRLELRVQHNVGGGGCNTVPSSRLLQRAAAVELLQVQHFMSEGAYNPLDTHIWITAYELIIKIQRCS